MQSMFNRKLLTEQNKKSQFDAYRFDYSIRKPNATVYVDHASASMIFDFDESHRYHDGSI